MRHDERERRECIRQEIMNSGDKTRSLNELLALIEVLERRVTDLERRPKSTKLSKAYLEAHGDEGYIQ